MRRTRTLHAAALVAVAALVGASCTQPDEDVGQVTPDEPADTLTASPSVTATASPTQTPSPDTSPTDGAPSPDETEGTAQTFIIGPQEPIQAGVDEEAQFSVIGRFDEGELPERLWLGVVPCEAYDLDSDTFTTSGDTVGSFDEDFGPRIVDVNGEQYENVDDVWPTQVHVQDGQLTFTVTSDQEACAVPVVFEDTNGNGELDLGSDGRPAEPYGIGKVEFG